MYSGFVVVAETHVNGQFLGYPVVVLNPQARVVDLGADRLGSRDAARGGKTQQHTG